MQYRELDFFQVGQRWAYGEGRGYEWRLCFASWDFKGEKKKVKMWYDLGYLITNIMAQAMKELYQIRRL